MDREAGYYWVRFTDEEYEVALWKDGYWSVINEICRWHDRDFEKIDEKRIKHYNR